MTEILLVGPLAHPAMLAALAVDGRPTRIRGRLSGGAAAGINIGDWPEFQPGQGSLPAVSTAMNVSLERYAKVMGLTPIADPQGRILGATSQSIQGPAWDEELWQSGLAAAIARMILEVPHDRPAAQIARRLPMLGIWADSRLRGQMARPSGGDLVALRDAGAVRVTARHEPFAGYFAVEEWHLSHSAHAGGFTPSIRRECFVMGDAVVVLPWDPRRDRVLLIEQFRMGPVMRQDPQPWLLEAVAGRVDAGEGIEDAARREAMEEADLTITHLFPAPAHYPSPGAVTEFLYPFVGIADLPDGVAGVHGLADETEDIRGHLLDRAELTRLVRDGQITNGPLLMLALWLDREAARLRIAAGL